MIPLILTTALLAPASDLDAKAALALAAASQPKGQPCEVHPNCSCGCVQGGPCTCASTPKDGATDGEWTYDRATAKWWKYVAHVEAPVEAHVQITPPVPGNVCAPVAQPALLFSPPVAHQAPAPVYSVSPPVYASAFRLASPSARAGWGGSFSSGSCGPGG